MERIAPAFAIEVRNAIDVARRGRGEVLFAVHAVNGATTAYVPGTARNREPYLTWLVNDAKAEVFSVVLQ